MELKTPKERETPDLLELVCQLHSRANRVMNKELHDAYVEARRELESRIIVNKISSNPVLSDSLLAFLRWMKENKHRYMITDEKRFVEEFLANNAR